ncbi:hypothetical protein JL100_024185 [Skermanella mucosa]|uniref:hypothetical protein n=1 Tax=Skermanella mucosa TaxID=1789672 RepID=UPI00192C7C5A|nr:hypothetical protein [Skermanella mucosa]UEM20143.1 hypothetical protein JL100_024185 [Skermanella mucosa]
MVAQMRAGVVVGTMMTIARKINGMDTRLTEGQARLEKRLDGVAEGQARLERRLDDVVEEQVRLRADIAVVTENTHSLNRKLNTLLTHMGLAE